MKRLRTWIGLTCILGLTAMGCGSLAGLLLPGTDDAPPIVCVVRYVQIAPGVDAGLDDCENYWLRYRVSPDSVECEIISEDGQSMIPIPCPAEGDTLGD